MSREEQIRQAALEHCELCGSMKEIAYAMFCFGARWADKCPDKKNVYTKQQLREMGFAFDLNGNIESPNDLASAAAHYIVDKACEWLDSHFYDYEFEDKLGYKFMSKDRLIEGFKKAMDLWMKNQNLLNNYIQI